MSFDAYFLFYLNKKLELHTRIYVIHVILDFFFFRIGYLFFRKTRIFYNCSVYFIHIHRMYVHLREFLYVFIVISDRNNKVHLYACWKILNLCFYITFIYICKMNNLCVIILARSEYTFSLQL